MLSASKRRHVGGAPQMWQKNGNSGPSLSVIVVLLMLSLVGAITEINRGGQWSGLRGLHLVIS